MKRKMQILIPPLENLLNICCYGVMIIAEVSEYENINKRPLCAAYAS